MSNQHSPPQPESPPVFQALFANFARGLATARNDLLVTADTPSSSMDFDLSKLSSEVEQLCEQGDFRSALPLSLQLFVQDHREPSAAFLLGSCLQRLDQPGLALAAFVQCTELEGELPTPAPLLRTGECLAALQMPQEAVAAFDRAVDLARSRPQDGDIQSMAAAKADVLRRNL